MAKDDDEMQPIKVFVPLILLLAGVLLVQSWLEEDSEPPDRPSRPTASEQRRESPQASYERQLQEALKAWEEGEGFWTRINDFDDMPTRNLFKTAERLRNDGTPGVAPVVRKRLRAGQRMLIYDGPVTTQGVDIWKVTDGETYGWISELQLESVPQGGQDSNTPEESRRRSYSAPGEIPRSPPEVPEPDPPLE